MLLYSYSTQNVQLKCVFYLSSLHLQNKLPKSLLIRELRRAQFRFSQSFKPPSFLRSG